MSSAARRLLYSALRTSTRASSSAARSPRARRMMSSGSHASHGGASNDTTWMIGSALVFGPLFLYLLSPSARKGSHEHNGADHEHKSHHVQHEGNHVQRESRREEEVGPISDDEGTEASGQEVKEPMEKAFEADSPNDAQKREEVVAKAETTAVEDKSAPALSEVEPSTGVTPALEPNPAPSSGVRPDDATPAATNEVAPSTAQGGEPTAESSV